MGGIADHLGRLTVALADHYRIQHGIGSGSSATVYLAEDLMHHRVKTVKVLRPQLAATLGAGRLPRETEVAAQIHHRLIVPLYDSGESEGFLFYDALVRKANPCATDCSRRARFRSQRESAYNRDVADARYAHQHRVVHRDIKPDNIMRSGRHALVTDLGVAKAVNEATGSGQLTTGGVALGTPAYMAPGQVSAVTGCLDSNSYPVTTRQDGTILVSTFTLQRGGNTCALDVCGPCLAPLYCCC